MRIDDDGEGVGPEEPSRPQETTADIDTVMDSQSATGVAASDDA
jgi:hypothetical protein